MEKFQPASLLSNETFNIESVRDLEKEIVDIFSRTFESGGYLRHEPLNSLVSEIDHSVRFIGSTTNVFKPLILNPSTIPAESHYLIQKCLRTRNVNTLFDDEVIPKWPSYFTAMGTIGQPESLDNLSQVTMEFLKALNLKSERVRINVSSTDEDLMVCAENIKKNFNFDIDVDGVSNILYYRHKYGVPGLIGRNFNISVKNYKSNQFEDIGNIVMIERNSEKVAVEMGIGTSTLISKIYNLNNTVEASTVSEVIPFQPDLTSKLSDCISTVVVMCREGIRPGSRDKARLLRTYLVGVKYLMKKLNLDYDQINNFINSYEENEFGNESGIGDFIIEYIKNNTFPYTTDIA